MLQLAARRPETLDFQNQTAIYLVPPLIRLPTLSQVFDAVGIDLPDHRGGKEPRIRRRGGSFASNHFEDRGKRSRPGFADHIPASA